MGWSGRGRRMAIVLGGALSVLAALLVSVPAATAAPASPLAPRATSRTAVYFEGEAGWVALGKLKRGTLSIGEKRFRKA